MKISLSLPDADVQFLDAYTAEHALGSRSAAVHHAVTLLHREGLSSAYEEAWSTWEGSAEDTAWESTISDGVQ